MCSPIPEQYYSISVLLLIQDSLGWSPPWIPWEGFLPGFLGKVSSLGSLGRSPPWLDVRGRSQWDAQRYLQVFHQPGGIIANGCLVPGSLCKTQGCFSQEGLGSTFFTSFRRHLLGRGEYKKCRKGQQNTCNKEINYWWAWRHPMAFHYEINFPLAFLAACPIRN